MPAERVIYIKAEQAAIVTNIKVYLSDVVKMTGPDKKVVKELGQEVLFVVPDKIKAKYAFSVLKIIDFIQKKHPDYLVVNEGEKDFIVEYQPPQPKKKWAGYTKIVFVCLAVAIGSAFTIMTFNQDVNVAEIFAKIYMIIRGEEANGPGMLEAGYCIGLPAGIIIFFNHFSHLKISSDPTPLQVQLRIYEKDENDAILKTASREGKTIDV